MPQPKLNLKLVRDVTAVAAGASLLLAEAAERHIDASRASFATQNLRALRRDAAAGREQEPEPTSTAAWLTRDAPQFPFLLGIPPGDDPRKVFDSVLGDSHGALVGSPNESTLASLSALAAPVGTFESAANAVAQRWKALKAALHADVPANFGPCARALAVTLDEVLVALEEIHGDAQDEPSSASPVDVNADGSPLLTPSEPASQPVVVFFLRDFDDWDNKDAATWLHWVHSVTRAGLAHVVIPTRASVTPGKLAALQALHADKGGEFVAIALRVATGAADATTAEDKVRALEAQFRLGLRVCEPALDDDSESLTPEADEEARIVVERVGNWWSDLASVFERLAQRGLGAITDRQEHLALVRAVCDEYEQEPVEALVPFGHRAEGEAKFLQLIDECILFLRPKADVEISVVPCAASDLLAPCWIETRPIVVRVFNNIWRNDHYFNAVQELERISTNTKLREEIALYAQEIDERSQMLDELRGEFLLMQHKLTKAERSTRAAELSLLELEIEAKNVYLERLWAVLRS